ncbi:hypothetical protein RSSM_03204 [Rhodopirellula sallentina SM41]|uniref:Uncharacterized protein n=1 Tax=Rhodopirellula sallentina SM41 TaxID=1263870 RepID=M5U1Q2_9BACT|nr:hypothetical protein RSSM_03204 [Rhodopirellula sallentina SM41]
MPCIERGLREVYRRRRFMRLGSGRIRHEWTHLRTPATRSFAIRRTQASDQPCKPGKGGEETFEMIKI